MPADLAMRQPYAFACDAGGLSAAQFMRHGVGQHRQCRLPGKGRVTQGMLWKAAERFQGKDTTGGHWGNAGLVLDKPFPHFRRDSQETPHQEFEKRIGRQVIGNRAESGTKIIQELGDEHVRTGFPIVYTSADSVFQIAAHEE